MEEMNQHAYAESVRQLEAQLAAGEGILPEEQEQAREMLEHFEGRIREGRPKLQKLETDIAQAQALAKNLPRAERRQAQRDLPKQRAALAKGKRLLEALERDVGILRDLMSKSLGGD